MFVLVCILFFKVFNICKVDIFLILISAFRKIRNEATLANPSWQLISGAMSKTCLKFSGDTSQPTSLTHVAFLGSWKDWSLRDLLYKSFTGRSIESENLARRAILPLLLSALILNKKKKEKKNTLIQTPSIQGRISSQVFKIKYVHAHIRTVLKSLYLDECEPRPRLLVSEYTEVLFT